MFKIVQGVLIASALGMAFGAGYQMKPVAPSPKTTSPTIATPPVSELPENSPAVDIRLPVKEMTPVASVPVDRQDVTFKWIEKELGINTTVLDKTNHQELEVLSSASRP